MWARRWWTASKKAISSGVSPLMRMAGRTRRLQVAHRAVQHLTEQVSGLHGSGGVRRPYRVDFLDVVIIPIGVIALIHGDIVGDGQSPHAIW
jgi:hypothetical protein